MGRLLFVLTVASRMVRWVIVGVVVAWLVANAVEILLSAPGSDDIPFEQWYGHWREVAMVSAVFVAFLLGFSRRPRRRAEWRSAGLFAAFVISLFTEMFGIPLTIYVLAPILGVPVGVFGMNESHLWAFALDRLGVVSLDAGVYLVMAISTVLVAAGLGLLATGWATVYQGRQRLVTEGLYHYVRHPQYLGLLMIVIGLNIMWPTLPTIAMAPVLIVMYLRASRREDDELAAFHGDAFFAYAARTPAFLLIPRRRVRPARGASTVRLTQEAETATSRDRPAASSATGDAHRGARRGLLVSAVAAAGTIGAGLWGWRPPGADGRGYREVARWTMAEGEGRFIAVEPQPTAEELRALGEQLREELRARETAVVMVFDDEAAARTVRHGSRSAGEERFQSALAHQRAMYVKHGRRAHRLVIYERYPAVREVIEY